MQCKVLSIVFQTTCIFVSWLHGEMYRHPSIKRTLCKRCCSLLVPGLTSTVRVQSMLCITWSLLEQNLSVFRINSETWLLRINFAHFWTPTGLRENHLVVTCIPCGYVRRFNNRTEHTPNTSPILPCVNNENNEDNELSEDPTSLHCLRPDKKIESNGMDCDVKANDRPEKNRRGGKKHKKHRQRARAVTRPPPSVLNTEEGN